MSATGGTSRGRGFARRDAQSRASVHFGPNMTPMVDVVMVILVFFMASAAFVGPEWFLANASVQQQSADATNSAASGAGPRRAEVVLTVRDGQVRATGLGRGELSLAGVLEAVAKLKDAASADKPAEMLIRSAPAVPYDAIIQIHAAAQKVGIVKVGVTGEIVPGGASK